LFQFTFGQNQSNFDFGDQLILENKHTEAISYFNKQLAEAKDSTNKALFLLELAEVYKLKLNFNTASRFYIKAFEEIKKANNYQLEFLYYVKMAEFYRKRALHKQTVVELDKANLLLKKYRINDGNLAQYYSRKAALFTEYYSIADSTLAYATKSLYYATKIEDKNTIFYSRLEIACLYQRTNYLKKAIKEFESLIQYAKANKLIQNEADVYINYVTVLIEDNQIEKALNEALKARVFAQKNDLLYNENMIVIKIYEIYKLQKKFEQANYYLENRQKLSEKYYKFEHNKFLFELEEKYKLADKEKQIEINKLALSNKDKKLKTNKTIFYVILGLFLIAILVALLIAYFLKKTKGTNKELQFLSQQNEFLLSEANHRINNNLQLIIILITVQLSKIPENEGQEIKKILKKIIELLS
jgi:two-component sensor histidine kinase